MRECDDMQDMAGPLDRHRRAAAACQLAAAIRACDPEDAAQIMAAALADLGAGMPQVALFEEQVREQATWWAEMATPLELEAYAAAALRKIERAAFCESARKRIFVSLWESFADGFREAFLSRVDPKGKFQGNSK